MQDDRRYPLRIRFWYLVHDQAERLWHWVYQAKIAPWHDACDDARIPPTYRMIAEVDATDTPQRVEIQPGVFVTSPAKDSGVTKQRIYRTNR